MTQYDGKKHPTIQQGAPGYQNTTFFWANEYQVVRKSERVNWLSGSTAVLPHATVTGKNRTLKYACPKCISQAQSSHMLIH
jgi:hypothetical protein